MTPITISAHAAQRYVERIAPSLTIDQAREAIRSHEVAIGKAWAFGCFAVLTAAGAKLVLEASETGGVAVVTVKLARLRRKPVSARMIRRFGKMRRAREIEL